jgi:hypothetical protein
VYVEIISLDVSQSSRGQLQRVELLSIDEHVPAGEAVVLNSVGALVMGIISASVRHWDGCAFRAA